MKLLLYQKEKRKHIHAQPQTAWYVNPLHTTVIELYGYHSTKKTVIVLIIP